MTRKGAVLIVAVLLAGGGIATAVHAWQQAEGPNPPAVSVSEPEETSDESEAAAAGNESEPAPAPEAAAPTARTPHAPPPVETPMAQRVAVLGLLNKRNGIARDVTMRPGDVQRIGDVIIRLRACDKTAPWEPQVLTGAFVQTDVRGTDGHWRRVFSGWLFKESPSLNAVQHPIYDVWVKSCAMTIPETGPDTIAASSLAGEKRSSAKKSAADAASGDKAPSNSNL
jgi:hypothetical protein